MLFVVPSLNGEPGGRTRSALSRAIVVISASKPERTFNVLSNSHAIAERLMLSPKSSLRSQQSFFRGPPSSDSRTAPDCRQDRFDAAIPQQHRRLAGQNCGHHEGSCGSTMADIPPPLQICLTEPSSRRTARNARDLRFECGDNATMEFQHAWIWPLIRAHQNGTQTWHPLALP